MGGPVDSPKAADSGKENGTISPVATPSTEPAIQGSSPKKVEQVIDFAAVESAG